MANCSICKNKISTTFLNKLLGTYIRDAKGKKKLLCQDCQRKYPTREEALSYIK